jgi:hypothetical protein
LEVWWTRSATVFQATVVLIAKSQELKCSPVDSTNNSWPCIAQVILAICKGSYLYYSTSISCQ